MDLQLLLNNKYWPKREYWARDNGKDPSVRTEDSASAPSEPTEDFTEQKNNDFFDKQNNVNRDGFINPIPPLVRKDNTVNISTKRKPESP
eukprot:CAMPEP_0168520702 /NCGR_PEP_ID=MMETSP0405-20121227/8187_1 /TAXON_ID=498012 /ORGANISM="Trichosphaerium sp, Strain Am-I-7 wt" /LENGTH=89 /DNA_ID=CAMNT_0008541719 /DNA_START=35 /DNA_END=301 /DNA_ORIENTATION=+